MDKDLQISIVAIASSHQGDIVRFGSSSVGRQCVPNCIASLVQFQKLDIQECTQNIMDKILDEGDRLYTMIHDNMTVKQDFFLLEDIPSIVSCFQCTWDFKCTDGIDLGLTGREKEDIESITTNFSRHFVCDTDAVMLLGNFSYAAASTIVFRSGLFYIFDSHSRSQISGMPVSEGHAILAMFKGVKDLAHYVFRLSIRLVACDLSVSTVSMQRATITETDKNSTQSAPFIQEQLRFETDGYSTSGRPITRSMMRAQAADDVVGTVPRGQVNSGFTDSGIDVNQKLRRQKAVQANVKKIRSNEDYFQQELKKNQQRIQQKRQDPVYVQQEKEKNKIRAKTRRQQNQARTQEIEDEDKITRRRRKNAEYQQKVRKRKASAEKNSQNNADDEVASKKRKKNKESQQKCRKQKTTQEREAQRKLDAMRKAKERADSMYLVDQAYKRQSKNYGENLQQSITIFHALTSQGPIYVCTACLQTMFVDDVDNVATLRPGKHEELLKKCCTGYISVDECEWLCHSCKHEIYQDKYPKLSKANKVCFPERPPELDLFPLEETLISPLLPFMTIRSLPVGGLTKEGQKLIVGNVVHVPNDIASTVRVLPRNLDNMGTIPVKLKRRKKQKTAVFQENIRPTKTLEALKWLMKHSEMYKDLKIQINEEEWLNHICNSDSDNRMFVEGEMPACSAAQPEKDTETSENDDDLFEEISSSEQAQGNLDTMLEENAPMQIYQEAELQASQIEKRTNETEEDNVYSLAPGENQIPVFRDELSEYKCFPSLFAGQKRPTNEERHRPVYLSEIYKAELRNVDPRVALNIPNIFYKAKILQIRSVIGRINLALRRVVGAKHNKLTAGDLLDADTRDNIRRLDEGYRIFRTLRNSPPYFEAKKRELNAMVRQLGYPTMFFSLSSADTKWSELIQCLGKLVDNKDYTLDYIQKEMTVAHRTKLVSAHPAACCRFFNHRVQKFLRVIIMGPHSPFGKVGDFFYRVEFQKRGSPHVHGFLWIDGAPNIASSKHDEICTYIDQHISCTSDVSEEDLQYVLSQKHSHSKTCKRMMKNKPTCRFGAPWPPMPHTMVLEPLKDISDTERDNLKKKYAQIIGSLDKLPPEVTTFDQFLKFVKLSLEEYLRLVQSSIERKRVFLKRRPCDSRINGYMKHLLGTWRANHDIQYVFDPYQCVTYICDYMTKSQKGMSEIMQLATQEAREGNMELKKAVRHIGNKLCNAAEASAQQCACDILQIPITNSSRAKEFINTSPPEERVGLVKSLKELEKMKPQSKNITHMSNIDRYAIRPKQLENWCLASYVAKTDIKYIRNANSTLAEEEEFTLDPEQEEVHEQDIAYEEGDGFPFTLRSGHQLRKRKHHKIIRFKTYSRKTNAEEYYRVQLLLYSSWRKENLLKGSHQSMEDAYFAKEVEILQNKQVFEPISNELEEAYKEFYDSQRNENPENTGNDDLDDDSPVPTEEFPIVTPDKDNPQHQIDIGPDLGIAPTLNDQDYIEHIDQDMTNEEYFALLKTLNQKQQEIHTHIIHQIKDNTHQGLFALHGGAGTGKSTVIKAISEGVTRILRQEAGTDFAGSHVLLVAPTGKAAYNIKGQTIHRAFFIPADQKMEYRPLKWDSLSKIQNIFRGIKLIVVDEFSMVGGRLLRFMHLRLQEVCGNQLPFGGMNILMCGDLYQLKPVRDCWIFQNIDNAYASLAPNLFQDNFFFFELIEIMRQKDDKRFAEMLNRIRTGTHSSQDLLWLQETKISDAQSKEMLDTPHFFTVNTKKDEFNNYVLEKTGGKSITIEALDHVSADLPKSNRTQILYSAKEKKTSACGNLAYELIIKEGVQYDITANINPADGIVNGAECVVQHIGDIGENKWPLCIWVQFRDNQIGEQSRKNVSGKYVVHAKQGWTPIQPIQRQFVASRSNILVTRKQFPLQLSAARTIHKAQSATYDKIIINMSTPPKTPKIFMEGIHYVALSRSRTFAGVHSTDLNVNMIRVSSKVQDFLNKKRNMLTLCYSPSYKNPNSLWIMYNNIGSLPKKWNAIENNHNLINADIFFIAETWLYQKYSTTCFQLDNFTQVRMDSKFSPHMPHRGMLMFLNKNLMVEDISLYQSANIEIMSCTFHINRHQRVVVAGVYKPPTTGYSALLTEIAQFKETVPSEAGIILLGDFNINLLDVNHAHFKRDMEQKHQLKQMISHATTWAGTLIDMIFTSMSEFETFAITNTWSYHHTIGLHMSL